ncbi:MAG: GGDEF domain-containing protein [Lachnospiraceae bacterium]
MRKRIAVFICAISFSNQRKILEGILDEAGKADMDVFVFTCHVNHSINYMKMDGAFSVMSLPDFANFDGAVIVKNSIQSKRVADELEERMKTSGIPSVSIDEDIDGMKVVGISDFEAQMMIMEELIVRQNCKRISYVTGITDNREGAERLRAYETAMAEHGISYSKADIFPGDYIGPTGRQAAKYFMKLDSLPDAIVCANDAMALGVIDELLEAGFRVPEDVKVTGFDNDVFARYNIPSITTIDRNQRELGRTAVQLILSNSESNGKHLVDAKLILRESSGNKESDPTLLEYLREAYSKNIGIKMQVIDTIKNMSLELAGLESISELCEQLKKYILASDMEACFLCLENEDGFIDLPLAFIDGEFSAFPPYEKGIVLPKEVDQPKKPAFYTVTALYYNDSNFGYIIQRGNGFALQSELAYLWVVNVGNAIENIRKLTLMKQMVEKLNAMWMYDTLTNIYNRGGFYHHAEGMLEELKKSDDQCYLIFMDLDGLKAINDNMGHESGDYYISSMASILKQTMDEEEKGTAICMRYGGDEFVAFGKCKSHEHANQVVKRINQNIRVFNATAGYQISCSLGMSIHEAIHITDLNALIEEADKKMYEAKKKRS